MVANHSGRFVLRLTPDLHARAAEAARRRAISLNEYCRHAVERYTDGDPSAAAWRSDTGRFVDLAREIAGDDLEAVVLFGSQARGEARASSDVDLLIVVSDLRELDRSLYRDWDEFAVDADMSPHFVHLPAQPTDAGSLWFEVALDGIVLYDRGGMVSRFLGNVRRAIADGRIRRLSAHGHPYWVKEGERINAE